MAIDPKLGFQIGSAAVNIGSALFGGGSGSNSAYEMGAGAFGAAQQIQQNSLDAQEQLYDQQAQIALDEGAEAARVKAMEGRQFAEQQALDYSGAGVLLAGTPMKVVNHTRAEVKKEIEYITKAAAAQANYFRQQKLVMQNEGRAALLGQSMGFTAQRAQAGMVASAQRASGVRGALDQLGGLFGTMGGSKSRFDPLAAYNQLPAPSIPQPLPGPIKPPIKQYGGI